MKVQQLAIAMIFTFTTAAAMAQPHGGHDGGPDGVPPDLSQFDTNGDGVVTRDEMDAARLAMFTSGDTDGNSLLSLAEFQALEAANRQTRLQAEFDAMDTDASGAIDADEFQNARPQQTEAVALRIFNYADTNADGTLSLTELEAMHTPEGRLLTHFAEMDADGDGALSETEFTTKP